MSRVTMHYVKEMQNYDYMRHTWREITNIHIVEKLSKLEKEYATYKFKYKIKLDRYHENRGKITVKSIMKKDDMILVIGQTFGGELAFKWR